MGLGGVSGWRERRKRGDEPICKRPAARPGTLQREEPDANAD